MVYYYFKTFFPAELCDYEDLSRTAVTDSGAEIILYTINDDIALEIEDDVHVKYKPTHPQYVKKLEENGEFFRDLAIVRIMDNDGELSAQLERCQTS